jgi:hypothetical protein
VRKVGLHYKESHEDYTVELTGALMSGFGMCLWASKALRTSVVCLMLQTAANSTARSGSRCALGLRYVGLVCLNRSWRCIVLLFHCVELLNSS